MRTQENKASSHKVLNKFNHRKQSTTKTHQCDKTTNSIPNRISCITSATMHSYVSIGLVDQTKQIISYIFVSIVAQQYPLVYKKKQRSEHRRLTHKC
jgi:hypothetical protein